MLSIKTFKEKILTNENFIFVKRGDGEVFCMQGQVGENCDNHPYSIELANELIWAYQTLEERHAIIVDFENQKDYNIFLHRVDNNVIEVVDFFTAIRTSGRPIVFIRPNKLVDMDGILCGGINRYPTVINVYEKNAYREIQYYISQIPSIRNAIYLFCAGMPAKVMIAEMVLKNPEATYIDCGSSFDPINGTSRTFQISKEEFLNLYRQFTIEPHRLKNILNVTHGDSLLEMIYFNPEKKEREEEPSFQDSLEMLAHNFKVDAINELPTVDFIIPTWRRPEGLKRCLDSIEKLEYPKNLIRALIDTEEGVTVPKKVKRMAESSKAEYIVFAANDTEFTPDSLRNIIPMAKQYGLVAFNTGKVLPDNGNICEHFIIRRSFIPNIGGEIFDTEFHHLGVDNLLWAKAEMLGEAKRCEEAVVIHHHFSNGGSEWDAVYQLGWEKRDEDRALLEKKLKELRSYTKDQKFYYGNATFLVREEF